MTRACRHCRSGFTEADVVRDLSRLLEIPETVARAARVAVYCGLECALLAILDSFNR